MTMSCLEIIQQACLRIGIVAPNAAVTSTNTQIIQLLALSKQEGVAQVRRYDWEVLQKEATFTTLAAQLQGTIASLAPGLKFIVNDTIWNRSQRLPVLGSKSPHEWQQMIAMNLTTPFSQYRVKADALYFYPVPPAGQTCAFEYMSKNWVSTSVGGTSDSWTNDADTPFLDDQLLIDGLVWRWKAAKGIDYSEDFATYERGIMDAMSRDASKPLLSLGGVNRYEISPIVIVPSGSWNAS